MVKKRKTLQKFLHLSLLSLALFVLPASLKAGPPPSENILIIYTNVTGYNLQLYQAFTTALGSISPAPTITSVVVSSTSVGIYNDLVAQTGKTDLSSWCQVYDLRFIDTANNQAYTGQNAADVVTYLGANNDTLLYTNYLNLGGSLFLQGEHHDYYIRNTNLLTFINSVAASPITQQYPNVYTGTLMGVVPTYSSVASFNTNFNTLTGGAINVNFPGGISPGSIGSGIDLVDIANGVNAMIVGYQQSNLKISSGKLVVSFETNAFTEPTLQNATSSAIIQNIYTFLSGCYHYTVTKAFSPTQVCVGTTGTFQICYNNTGTRALSNVSIWDTIPTCLTFQSSSPAPTSSSGNVYQWTISTIPSGSSNCVTVNYLATSFPPCP